MLLFRNEEELGRLNLYAVINILIALSINSLVLWLEEDKINLMIKDLVNLFIIVMMIVAYLRKMVHFSSVTVLSIYTLYINIVISFLIRGEMNSVEFEHFFLKAELVITLLIISIGLLSRPIHMIYSIIFNLGFILLCILLGPDDFPILKYLFFTLIVTGGELVGWRLYIYLDRLRESASKAKESILQHNRELIEINKQKDQLFRIIGHDIRTPLGHIEFLVNEMEHNMEKEAFDELKALMLRASDKGNSLLQDLLVWAKAQASEAHAVMEECSPYELCEEEMGFVEDLAKTKSIKMVNAIDPEKVIRADTNMTCTIIRNLLSNAIKFSFRDSEIKIDLQRKGKEYWLRVKDQGVGMRWEHVQEILNEGKVTSMRGTEHEEGTGFGIMICQKLAEHQGGRIDIYSEFGKGSTLSLVLPV